MSNGRAVQGIGAGGLQTLTFVSISEVVSPRERGKYQGIISACLAVSLLLGPALGGTIHAIRNIVRKGDIANPCQRYRRVYGQNQLEVCFVYIGCKLNSQCLLKDQTDGRST